jgi:hypothetical protein
VNVPARPLQHPEFVEHVDAALAWSDMLTLELTESVRVELDAVVAFL